MKRFFTAGALALLLLSSSGAQAADGIVLQRAALPVQVQQSFATQIAQARAKDPGAFVAVREAVARAGVVDAKARARKAPIGRYLAGLGPSALLPMIELAAFDAPATEVTPKLRRDLVEGIGLLRDARALPLLAAILEHDADDEMIRTAAEAMGRASTDEAAQKLLASLATAKGTKRTAILSGMSDCRRVAIANALAAEAGQKMDEAAARSLAKSLGNVGNAWAWKTLASRSDEAAVRETAARALVGIFVAYSGETRTAASNALMVVDAPSTPALVANAKQGASPDTIAALDALAARFAQNPAR